MKKLSDLKTGKKARIISFDKSVSRCEFERFALHEGQIIKCIAKIGPIIIKEKDQTIAVGKKLANCVLVEEVDE